MKTQQAKTKLAVIDTPGFGQVLFDALHTYIADARGEEVDEIHLANMADALMVSLKRQYQPVVQSNLKQIDLEKSIKSIKAEKKGCQHHSIGTDGGGDYCNKCGKRWSR